MNNEDYALEDFWESTIFAYDLPVGIYSITPEGNLITCNRKASAILKLPEGDLTHSIKEFYADPSMLEQMQNQLHVASSPWIETRILLLKVGGSEVIVQHHMRAIKNAENGQTVGFLCCMADITEEEHYRQLFDSLPVGIYEVDEQERLVNTNPAMAKMLGYESPSELENQLVREFYLNKGKASEFRQLVENSPGIVKQSVELLKKDGEIISASVIARQLRSDDGEYHGRQGAIIDVTQEEHYRRLLEEMPVGLYEVRLDEQGESIVKHCNQQFATLIESDTVQQTIGFDVRELYPRAEVYEKLKEAIEETAKANEPLLGYWLPLTGRKGKEMVLEVNTRVLRDINQKIIGRVGVVRDVGEEAELKEKERRLSEKVQELTRDIGAVLHSYSTALLNTRQSANVVIRSLGPDPIAQRHGMLPEEASTLLSEPAKALAQSLTHLIEAAEAPHRADIVSAEQKSDLLRQLHLLRNYETLIPYAVAHPSTLRESAILVLGVCDGIDRGRFAKDIFRRLKADAQDLMRICNLITLHQISDLTLEMDHIVSALRSHVLSGVRGRESRSLHLVRDMVSQTTTELHEFARSRGIAFKIKHDDPDCQVEVAFRDVVRALSNLLHNAIKYSWERPGGSAPWIYIHTKCDGEFVRIEFANYGVPIPKEEIQQGLIFQFGFRGRKSSDRRRTGTGIGLADALQVAKEHGGNVVIESHPASFSASFSGKEDDYKQPFLTTAIFMLPAQSRKE